MFGGIGGGGGNDDRSRRGRCRCRDLLLSLKAAPSFSCTISRLHWRD